MKNTTRTLILGASAIFALSTLTACSGSNDAAETPSETAAPASVVDFPESAKYIADMPTSDGRIMTIGIAVDGDQVAAYACDGTSDEAWFFGTTEADGTITIKNKFDDTLDATFDGTDVDGTLTMNDEALAFDAPEVAAPAGMYTVDLDGTRASWVVREDASFTGVQSDRNAALENFQEEGQQNQQSVRERRLARLLGQADPLKVPPMTSTINGTPVTAKIVNGDTRFG